MEKKNRELKLEFQKVFCRKHGEPYREQWPRGYSVAVLELFKAVMESEEFAREMREAGFVAEDGLLDHDRVGEMLQLVPLCCRVPPRILKEVYLKSDIGRERKCVNCEKKKFGTSVKVRMIDQKTHKIPHLCFDCLLFRLRKLR